MGSSDDIVNATLAMDEQKASGVLPQRGLAA